jgi:hypothetical protein
MNRHRRRALKGQSFDPREAERALFVIAEAERLGLRFSIRDSRHLEVDFPHALGSPCLDSLRQAITRSADMIGRLVALRSGWAP